MNFRPRRPSCVLLAGLLVLGCSDSGSVLVTEPQFAGVPEGPQILYTGGTVITVAPIRRVHEAILIQGDRVVATGRDRALRRRARPDAVEVDLAGRTVMPGFIDPHNHIFNQVFLGRNTELWGTTYDEGQQAMLEAGWTSIANPNVWPDAAADFVAFAQSGDLRIRTSVYLAPNDFCGEDWPVGWYLGYGLISDPTAMFRIPGLKLFTDGGACNRASYTFLEDGGDLYLEAEDVATVIGLAESKGYQLVVHALGDRAVTASLDGFEIARERRGGGRGWGRKSRDTPRHRMDHLRWVPPEQRPRFQQVGVTPVFFTQPSTCSIVLPTGGWRGLMREENAHLRPWFDPIKAVVEENPRIRVTAKSDAAFFRLPAMENLWSLVTRDVIGPYGASSDGMHCEAPDFLAETGLDVESAIEVLTINAAHALGVDGAVGSLRRGKLADLVVLSANPLETDPDALKDITVLMTMVGGRTEYCADGAGDLCDPSGAAGPS